MNNPELKAYLHQFSHLRANKNRKFWTETTKFYAPHKPILLLSILDLIQQAEITTNFIEVTPALSDLFAKYWRIAVLHRHRGNLALPFFHLRSSSFWHLLPKPGKENHLENIRKIDTLSQLQKYVLGVKLDDELFQLMQIEKHNNTLRNVLINSYFDPTLHEMIVAQSEMNYQAYVYSQQLINQVKQGETIYKIEKKETKIRDQGFRKAVVGLYEHRCAFCGIRMLTTEGHTVVEAAHIIPWHVSYNDDPRNGISLCKLCHWAFDEGLLSLTDKYAIMLSRELRVTSDLAVPNLAGHLLTFDKRSMIKPNEELFSPHLESIHYHRKKIFKN